MVKKPALKRGVLYSFSSEDVTMISGVTEAFKKSVDGKSTESSKPRGLLFSISNGKPLVQIEPNLTSRCTCTAAAY